MTFKKLALASAIALVPTMGFSAQELTDETLSTVTGQDGIEIDIAAPVISANIYIHDTDGLGATGIVGVTNSAAQSFDGAIVMEGFSFAGNMNIDIDAGDNAGGPTGAPVLNINVSIPTATIITGAIKVANSQRDDGTPAWGINTMSAALLNTMTIAMAGLTMNIQLGNEPQGNMIAINSTITNGLLIDNFALNDANSLGSIGMASMLVKDTGASADLQLKATADASAAGLVVGLTQVGSTTGMDIRITDMYLGTTGVGIIGDITVSGLNLGGTTLTISGK